MNWLMIAVLALAAIAIGIVGSVTGYPETWAVAGILALLLGGHALYDKGAGRHAESSGHDGSLPAAQVEGDDGTALGDSAEVHDELDPLDLPRDHPARHSDPAQRSA